MDRLRPHVDQKLFDDISVYSLLIVACTISIANRKLHINQHKTKHVTRLHSFWQYRRLQWTRT